MKNKAMLQTVQLICNKKPRSPWLVTTQEYGRFMLDTFDESICSYILFKQESKEGEPVRVYHPGSRLGLYFDKNEFSKPELMSTFVKYDSVVFTRLHDLKLASYKDFNKIKVNGAQAQNLLRLYTVDQIALYIKQNVDYNFNLLSVLLNPKQIRVRECDMEQIITPLPYNKIKKRLIPSSTEGVELTMDELEKRLGYKVSIVSKGGAK